MAAVRIVTRNLGTPVLNSPVAGDGQVALSWSDVAGETGYDIHRSTTSPVATDGSDLLTAGSGALAAGTESYTDSTAVNGTTYYYRVSATDGSSTTYSNEVSGAPSAASFDPTPNEPAGYTRIVNRHFNDKADTDSDRGTGSYPDKTGGSEGWNGGEFDSDWVIASDATAPEGGSENVWYGTYPAGEGGGASNAGYAYTETFTTFHDLSYKELYVAFAWKHSSNWEGHSSSVNKLLFWKGDGPGGNQPNTVLTSYGSDSNPMKLVYNLQGTPDHERPNLQANVAGADATGVNDLTRGEWHWVEIQMVMNDKGSSNGVLRIWYKGTLTHEYTDIEWVDNSVDYNGDYWNQVYLNPIWGGVGDTLTNDQYLSVDYVLVGGAPGAVSPTSVTFSASNPRFLFYEDGSPFFLAGTGGPENFLHRGTKEADGTRSGGDQQTIIDALVGSGVNSIYMMVDATGDSGADAHPFTSYGSPEMDEDILVQWEGWFGQLDAAGITMFLILYDDSADPFNTATMGADEESFVGTLVDRFKGYDHLIWVVAEEYSEDLSTTRASEIAGEIKAHDSVHPVAIHQIGSTTFDFADDANFDQFAMQSGKTEADDTPAEVHSRCLTAWSNAAGRYNVHLAELNNTLGHGEHTTAEIRQLNWAAAMAGAYVSVYRWWEPNAPSTTELNQLGYIRSFMEATRFDLMEPDDSRASGDTDWVLTHKSGNDYHIGYGTSVSTGVGFTSLDAATYDLTWMDTETGDQVTEQQTATAGSYTFTKPGGISGSEVVLYASKV